MELNEVEALHAQAAQRLVDDALDIGFRNRGEPREVGDELRVHLEGARRLGSAPCDEPCPEGADQGLDPGVDIGAIEGRQPGVERRLQGVERLLLADGAVAAGELPIAADDARDGIAGADLSLFDHRRHQRAEGERPWWRHG